MSVLKHNKVILTSNLKKNVTNFGAYNKKHTTIYKA